MKLLLASGSPYRKQLLERLELEFSCQAPDIDETPLPGETAEALSLRLSEAKARALAESYPDHLIIASDQAAQLGQTILGKPGTHHRASEQLLACSNQAVTFYTGLCLLNTRTGKKQLDCIPFTVHFRQLNREQVERYIKKEEPLDCAGSFKCEGLGITLFTKMSGDDPNSLTGLPLIRLTDMLLNEGISII
ncbi:Maf family nucleotide pyrophosphatase [Endozoicomonas gorgoniicola]|uniref:7-methyl-GTP pyrophosphatase n=1 Tax=Endozoicomonas gorgoniicola TaxID=1234144 RepID=A0ABT3MWH1_9GAMM|nr:nucleoside triphosphate pyrophosphatase [Endozoicomonas gorgoniicola]MCW7553408.1 Maf family nucleotide pyrophosphatase [Endozoicomonas gorgoniicola]